MFFYLRFFGVLKDSEFYFCLLFINYLLFCPPKFQVKKLQIPPLKVIYSFDFTHKCRTLRLSVLRRKIEYTTPNALPRRKVQ
jgi:hypothetical protein